MQHSYSEIEPKRNESSMLKFGAIAGGLALIGLVAVVSTKMDGKLIGSSSSSTASMDTIMTTIYSADEGMRKTMWETYKKTYNKDLEYHTVDIERIKFSNFIENMKLADERNAENIKAGGKAVHGITKFSDMTQEEYLDAYFSSTKIPSDAGNHNRVLASEVTESASEEEEQSGVMGWWWSKKTVSPSFRPTSAPAGALSRKEWSEVTTGVKNQKGCKSGWAYAGVSQIESEYMILNGFTTDDPQTMVAFSNLQIVDCNTFGFTCTQSYAATPYTAFKTAQKFHIEHADDYLSSTSTETCKANSTLAVARITSMKTVQGESSMQEHLMTKGPLTACIDPTNWSTYTGGVITAGGANVIHCVQIVGFEWETATRGHYIIRNSFGTDWGETIDGEENSGDDGGFARILYGDNVCGIGLGTTPNTVTVANVV